MGFVQVENNESLLTWLVRSRWLDIGFVLLFAFLWSLTPSKFFFSLSSVLT